MTIVRAASFLAPSRSGGIADLMLNGTGMIETDLLLLDVMAAGEDRQAWQRALADNDVPEEIHQITAWCGAPVLSDTPVMDQPSANETTFAAIERLLWRWKTPCHGNGIPSSSVSSMTC